MLGYAAAQDQNYFMASFVQVPYPLCNAHVAHVNDIVKHKLFKSKNLLCLSTNMHNVLINHTKEVGKKTGRDPLLMPPRDDIIDACTNLFHVVQQYQVH